MSNHGPLSNQTPGWYVSFQADVLLQLPRPSQITATMAKGWHGNRGALKQALRKALCAPHPYSVVVNYDRSVKEAIAAGKYDWSNEGITSENFPSKRTGIVEMEIILPEFSKCENAEDAMKQLAKRGFRAAELRELLAFGEEYPEVQEDLKIFGFGSVMKDFNEADRSPWLGKDNFSRILQLGWLKCGWHPSFRIAAVRK